MAPSKDWGPAYTPEEWQRIVDLYTADLDRLASAQAGRTTIKVAGELRPKPGGTSNEWMDWSPAEGKIPGTEVAGDVSVVYFPTKDAAPTAVPLNPEDPHGTVSFIELDPSTISTYIDPKTGEIKGIDPTVVNGHELGHAADFTANTHAPEERTLEINYSKWTGGTVETPGTRAGTGTAPVHFDEFTVHGGQSGMGALMLHLLRNPADSPIPVLELSTESNPWRTKAAQDALKALPTASHEEAAQLKLLINWASENPTEVKIATELETAARPAYVGGQYLDRPDGLKDGPTLEREPGVGQVIPKEDLEAPFKNKKLRVKETQFTPPSCSAGVRTGFVFRRTRARPCLRRR